MLHNKQRHTRCHARLPGLISHEILADIILLTPLDAISSGSAYHESPRLAISLRHDRARVFTLYLILLSSRHHARAYMTLLPRQRPIACRRHDVALISCRTLDVDFDVYAVCASPRRGSYMRLQLCRAHMRSIPAHTRFISGHRRRHIFLSIGLLTFIIMGLRAATPAAESRRCDAQLPS